VDLTVTLTDDQLEPIAIRVAELLADRQSSEPAAELLTVAQAAELAGVSATTVRNWLSAGRLTRQGVPGGPMVARADLMTLLAGPPRTRTSPRTTLPKRGRPAGTFTALARDSR